MYKDYLDAILEHYQQKKISRDLPPRLLNSSPSKIRDECVFVYRTRFDKKDLPRLMSFFEVYEGADVLKAIERFDIDKFRPLNNYLKESTEKTDDKNIELLGWLLDFSKRPYNKHDFPGLDVTTADEQGNTTSTQTFAEGEGNVTDQPTHHESLRLGSGPIANNKPSQRKPGRLTTMHRFIIGTAIAASGVFTAVNFVGKEDRDGCMIWTNDHYEPISCDSSGNGKLIVARDENLLRYMRRITRPDTLTRAHISKVWYRKRGGDSLDYFTIRGGDPVDPTQDLKQLTAYIYNTYLDKINSADSSGSDSRLRIDNP